MLVGDYISGLAADRSIKVMIKVNFTGDALSIEGTVHTVDPISRVLVIGQLLSDEFSYIILLIQMFRK